MAAPNNKLYYSGIEGGQPAAATHYFKADGTKTSTATDPSTWHRRDGVGPIVLRGSVLNATGTSTITVEQAATQGGAVARESAALSEAALRVGARIDAEFEWFRIKLVQGTAATTHIYLSVDEDRGDYQ